ncbi:phosphodiesterase [Vibrio sp.]|uniref:phosphodiesterase n=1 Tax=Vibrio sp. TaxID=678 RepID=UPI003D0B5C51
MKLFFASDIHGSLPATEQVLTAFQHSGADQLILLGDILNHGPRNPIPAGYQPTEVAEALNQYANQIIAVRGNCDSEVDQMLLKFPIMADYAWLLLENGTRLFLTHGHLYHQDQIPPLAEGDVLVHGHTHIPKAERCDHFWLCNPGSVTFPRGDFAASYALYEHGQWRVFTFNGEQLAQAQF